MQFSVVSPSQRVHYGPKALWNCLQVVLWARPEVLAGWLNCPVPPLCGRATHHPIMTVLVVLHPPHQRFCCLGYHCCVGIGAAEDLNLMGHQTGNCHHLEVVRPPSCQRLGGLARCLAEGCSKRMLKLTGQGARHLSLLDGERRANPCESQAHSQKRMYPDSPICWHSDLRKTSPGVRYFASGPDRKEGHQQTGFLWALHSSWWYQKLDLQSQMKSLLSFSLKHEKKAVPQLNFVPFLPCDE
mmetsp:Transcript_36462/g.46442  ORF Transcript_36462/g.46442 Transcript_36462/m.46442 type:complete len:242 (+) Transcript_36462:857-1582(+)